MKRLDTRNALMEFRKNLNNDLKIGFVPTMGALHEGHLSLVEASKKENDITIVSIFVNPTQFNDPKDLDKYPRTLDQDIALLDPCQIDGLFVPSTEDIYDQDELNVTFKEYDFDGLDEKLEGAKRPGHFNGVVQVVSKLLTLVQPHKIYLGQKDYQQFLIIDKLTQLMDQGTDAIMMPIKREENGLAMSSRNQHLSDQDKIEAAVLYNSMKKMDKSISLEESIVLAKEHIQESPICKELEYLEVLNALTLNPITEWDQAEKIIVLVAIQTDKVRLIDNMFI